MIELLERELWGSSKGDIDIDMDVDVDMEKVI